MSILVCLLLLDTGKDVPFPATTEFGEGNCGMYSRKWRWVVHIVCMAMLAWMILVGVSYQRLRHTTSFAVGGVGIVGRITDEETMTRNVMAQPFAIPMFQALCADREASWSGRLYALWGLRQFSRQEFNACRVQFLNSKATVTTWQGCLRGEEKVGDVIQRIENNE